MGIRNVALALLLSVSLLGHNSWTQEKTPGLRGPEIPGHRADPTDAPRRRHDPFIMSRGHSGRILGAPSTAGDNTAGGAIISVASLKVPKKAAKEFRKARKAARKKKYEEALGRLRKATEMYPQYAEAFNEMGLVYRLQNQNQEARQAFKQAIAADSK